MMTNAMPSALRLLAHFWLEEVRADDLPLIEALPDLAETLPEANAATLIDLAAAYQHLFGFNLPPYESVFVDPSAMLLAPATAGVEALYRQANWRPPAVRAGAPDHLGLELLALADWLEAGRTGPARQLQAGHLALWAPALILTLPRLEPSPFYAALAQLTLDLLLGALPAQARPAGDPFPVLPPPPVYTDQGMAIPAHENDMSISLRDVIKHLLTPCKAGFYLAREDIAQLSQTLDLPAAVGERVRMLETLFRLAGQYDLVPSLLRELTRLLDQAGATYGIWADEYPLWRPYAAAWRKRLATSRQILTLDT